MKTKMNFLNKLAIRLYDYSIQRHFDTAIDYLNISEKYEIKSEKYRAKARLLIQERNNWVKRLRCK